MAFREVRFPTTLTYGATGGAGWSTGLATVPSGYRQVGQRWTHIRGQWEVGLSNRSAAETQDLLAFFYCIGVGRVHGFRFQDPEAGESTGTNEPLGIGTGSAVQYQLLKRYSLGSSTYDRIITKPVTGSVTVTLDNVPTGSFSVDTTTGLVTLTAGVGVAIRASYQFDVPVRFNVDRVQIQQTGPDSFLWPSVLLCEVRDIAV